MSRFTRRERALVGAAIGLAGSAAAFSTIGMPVAAAFAAGGAAFAAGVDFLWRRVTRPAPERSQIEKFVNQGRKLTIYEHQSGLFSHWYMELRGKEECDRAQRYNRELAFLVVEPIRSEDEWATMRALQIWFGSELRHSDVAGYLGNGRYLIIMPEADGESATHLIRRLKLEGYATDVGLSVFPLDGKTYDELYKAASAQLPISLRHVA
jgi:hypothetical protein